MKVDVQRLVREFLQVSDHSVFWKQRARLAEDATWCQWPDQWDDGLKHAATDTSPEPFPFEGANDARVRACAQAAFELSLVCNAAFEQGQMRVAGTELSDAFDAGKVTELVKWVVQRKMGLEAARERRLALRWRNIYGLSVTYNDWERKQQLRLESFELEDLAAAFGLADLVEAVSEAVGEAVPLRAAAELAPVLRARLGSRDPEALGAFDDLHGKLLNFLDLIDNEAREAELKETLRASFGESLSSSFLDSVVTDLRERGEASLPRPYVCKNQPTRKALQVLEHVFFPTDTCHLQEARWIVVREWWSQAELEAMRSPDAAVPEAERWDSGFIDEVLEHAKGKSSTHELSRIALEKSKRWSAGQRGWEQGTLDHSELYELLVFYRREVGPEGVEGIYRTITCAHIPSAVQGKDRFRPRALVREDRHAVESPRSAYATHGLYRAGHDKLPFTAHVFDHECEALMLNVGLPYLTYTDQNVLKAYTDYMVDAGSIAIMPPVEQALRDWDVVLDIGPNGRVPPGTKFMQPMPARHDLLTLAAAHIERRMARMGGQFHPEVPPPVVQLIQQYHAACYLEEEKDVLEMILANLQLFMEEETVIRAIGGTQRPFVVRRQDIQGHFDLQIVFDTRMLDQEFALKKVEAILQLKQYDATNRLDMDRVILNAVAQIDPFWAEAITVDGREASEKEIEDERANVVRMLAGQEPPMRENGQNFELRLQVLQNEVQVNPRVQALAQSQNPADAAIMELFQRRALHLQRMAAQFGANAQAGRVQVRQ